MRRTPAKRTKPRPATRLPRGAPPVEEQVEAVVAWIRRTGNKTTRDGMARYGIPSNQAFGVPVGVMQRYAKGLGRNHELSLALWDTGWYEARMLAAFLGEPAKVTPAQMDRWSREFDSWAICDTVCFHLFDHSPHAWAKVRQWAGRRDEFVKRAAFALLAGLTLHDKAAGDAPFLAGLKLLERAGTDERHYVQKGVNWALRCIGKRSLVLNASALAVAKRLAARPEAGPRWVGKHALRELTSPSVTRRLAARRKARP